MDLKTFVLIECCRSPRRKKIHIVFRAWDDMKQKPSLSIYFFCALSIIVQTSVNIIILWRHSLEDMKGFKPKSPWAVYNSPSWSADFWVAPPSLVVTALCLVVVKQRATLPWQNAHPRIGQNTLEKNTRFWSFLGGRFSEADFPTSIYFWANMLNLTWYKCKVLKYVFVMLVSWVGQLRHVVSLY